MIKDNQKYFNRLHLVIDALVVACSYVLSWYIMFGSTFTHRDPAEGVLEIERYMFSLIFLVPGYVVLYYTCNLYKPKRTQRIENEIANIVKANSIGVILYFVILYMARQIDYSRLMIAIFYVLNIILTILMRLLVRWILHSFRAKGYNLKYILLVGYSRAAEEYIERINSNPHWGYVVRGILDDKVPRGATYKGVKVIGSINNLLIILPVSQLDEIAITLSLDQYDRLEEIVGLCEKSGVHTKFIPDYQSLIPSSPYMEDLQGLPVINIRYVPLSNTLNAVTKRFVDIVGSLFGILVLSPLMLIVALLVRFTSKGPVFFGQERVGLHNKTFKMYKFRTMEQQAEDTEKKGWTVRNDPRVTRIGKILRRTSIDELPQLFNILMGNMSIVGPRPERPQFVEKFKEEIPRYMIKHQVRPGLTGWAQINGYRGNTSIRKRIEYDIYYIENWSMGFDIKIMFLTIFKGLMNENAY